MRPFTPWKRYGCGQSPLRGAYTKPDRLRRHGERRGGRGGGWRPAVGAGAAGALPRGGVERVQAAYAVRAVLLPARHRHPIILLDTVFRAALPGHHRPFRVRGRQHAELRVPAPGPGAPSGARLLARPLCAARAQVGHGTIAALPASDLTHRRAAAFARSVRRIPTRFSSFEVTEIQDARHLADRSPRGVEGRSGGAGLSGHGGRVANTTASEA